MVLLTAGLRVFVVLVISELSRRARTAAIAERHRVDLEDRRRTAHLFDLLLPGVVRPPFEEDIPVPANWRELQAQDLAASST